MNRAQFSLRRLLTNLVVLSAVFGFAVTYPVATGSFTVFLLLIAPTVIVAAFAWRISTNRQRTMIVVLIGAFIGWLLSPQIFVTWATPPTFWDQFLIDFDAIGIWMAVVTLAAAILEWAFSNLRIISLPNKTVDNKVVQAKLNLRVFFGT